jgi:hypothetical protein
MPQPPTQARCTRAHARPNAHLLRLAAAAAAAAAAQPGGDGGVVQQHHRHAVVQPAQPGARLRGEDGVGGERAALRPALLLLLLLLLACDINLWRRCMWRRTRARVCVCA